MPRIVTTMIALATLTAFAHVPSALAQCPTPETSDARLLPSYFDHGRVLAAPVTTRGDTVYFILDSGGGFNAFAENRVEPLGLSTHRASTGTDTTSFVALASLADSSALPAPTAGYPHDGSLVISNQLNGIAAYYGVPTSGFLGGGWWADRVWQIDYLRHKLWLYPHSVLTDGTTSTHQIKLGSRTDSAGVRPTNFARVRARSCVPHQLVLSSNDGFAWSALPALRHTL